MPRGIAMTRVSPPMYLRWPSPDLGKIFLHSYTRTPLCSSATTTQRFFSSFFKEKETPRGRFFGHSSCCS
uniref:Uncharacterized protein n=1 Tax=Salix viminalis TaxID=40686 RepID=A0A6N2K5W7_SALVM